MTIVYLITAAVVIGCCLLFVKRVRSTSCRFVKRVGSRE
jgi:hypothetical protein